MTELRPYQLDAVAEINRVVAAGKRRPLLVAPTGSGKTLIFTALIKQFLAEGKRVVVIAHSREIINQTSLKLSAHNIEHGIILAGLVVQLEHPVQVCSIQTLWARAIRTEKMPLPSADLLVIDEAHHCPAHTYRKIIESYPHAVLLGTTATPCRGDGRGLGGIFDVIVETPQVAELIADKFLVKTRVYAPSNPDLKGVRVQAGDYVESQLAERMDRADLVGDIISHWHKHGERRKTVCFAVNVAHSLHIRNEFIKAGVRAEHIDGSTPKPDRDAALARLASGETELISNCQVLGEGWDLPAVSCVILARPTRKMGLFRQMVGRILRPAPDKINAIVLDHSGAVFRHGFVEDRVDWTLDPEKRSESPAHNARLRSGYSSRLLECSQCGSMRVAGEPCPHCGFLPQRPPRAIVFKDGDLALVDRTTRTATDISNPDERLRWHGMLTHIQQQRHRKPGWVFYAYQAKFGERPPVSHIDPIPPTQEVLSWVRSRDIAYAKAKSKETTT
jgi:DNA repair protein RadD